MFCLLIIIFFGYVNLISLLNLKPSNHDRLDFLISKPISGLYPNFFLWMAVAGDLTRHCWP